VRVDVAAQVNRHFERVAVQAAALVTVWHVGQAVGGFEGEFFENFHRFRLFKVAVARQAAEFISLVPALRDRAD
jgi:hypothetical protein